ncbi:hypothetical protein [Mycoplasma sp. Mirounga ES2805-ORL]|uniref:hypothetical protein n=1 Tax=Mycoplasma sp. Mirounga ES2805-ORL TaxID=754514 RepID=UPI00197C1329|nr:hypothetical protein [Mycoplasma sp. Mirounga ES2805-ORL]QSF13656.1 hypothetical protein JXZ90_03245 [Mycoplasma sp. Mirounga ES2805-ORL]
MKIKKILNYFGAVATISVPFSVISCNNNDKQNVKEQNKLKANDNLSENEKSKLELKNLIDRKNYELSKYNEIQFLEIKKNLEESYLQAQSVYKMNNLTTESANKANKELTIAIQKAELDKATIEKILWSKDSDGILELKIINGSINKALDFKGKAFSNLIKEKLNNANATNKLKKEAFDNLDSTKTLINEINIAQNKIEQLNKSDKNVEIEVEGVSHKISEWVELEKNELSSIEKLSKEKSYNLALIKTDFNAQKAFDRINAIPEDNRSDFAKQLLIDIQELMKNVNDKNVKIDNKINGLKQLIDSWQTEKVKPNIKQKFDEYIAEANELDEANKKYQNALNNAISLDAEWNSATKLIEKVKAYSGVQKNEYISLDVQKVYTPNIIKYIFYLFVLEDTGAEIPDVVNEMLMK